MEPGGCCVTWGRVEAFAPPRAHAIGWRDYLGVRTAPTVSAMTPVASDHWTGNRRELVQVLLGVLGIALILNHVDDLFGHEVSSLSWLYAVAAAVDLAILVAYLRRRRA